ncbi:hypothetical protein R3P38DRAFT_3166099 [Favolaschia claudopus]|uniref:F-box domain-containing protein n=1 Tax=Favolaschia claudopus TaxID=2862362 RepID=A0AAW0EIJ7_9AGAR
MASHLVCPYKASVPYTSSLFIFSLLINLPTYSPGENTPQIVTMSATLLQTFPYEVLSETFLFTVASGTLMSPKKALSLSHVCQQWRYAALSDSTLWIGVAHGLCTRDVLHVETVVQLLRRSGDATDWCVIGLHRDTQSTGCTAAPPAALRRSPPPPTHPQSLYPRDVQVVARDYRKVLPGDVSRPPIA